MPEIWEGTAARRFNETITLKPTDLFWPQHTESLNKPEPEPLIEMTELIIETVETTYNWWVDMMNLGRVA